MRLELLNEAAERAEPRLLGQLITFTRFPTERNSCYLTGYVGALEAHGHLSHDDASYWRAFIGRYEGHPEWTDQATRVLKDVHDGRNASAHSDAIRKAE